MIKTIMNILAKEIKQINEECYCEIEYFGEDWIDVSIYDDSSISELILNRFLQNHIIHNTWNNDEYIIEIPSDDEIKYGFCGNRFERIVIDLPDSLVDDGFEFLMQVEV